MDPSYDLKIGDINMTVLSHPVDIGDQDSLFRRVNPLVVGPHTTLDGEQQHLQVSLLLEPERKRDTCYIKTHLNWIFTIVMSLFGDLPLPETV